MQHTIRIETKTDCKYDFIINKAINGGQYYLIRIKKDSDQKQTYNFCAKQWENECSNADAYEYGIDSLKEVQNIIGSNM